MLQNTYIQNNFFSHKNAILFKKFVFEKIKNRILILFFHNQVTELKMTTFIKAKFNYYP